MYCVDLSCAQHNERQISNLMYYNHCYIIYYNNALYGMMGTKREGTPERDVQRNPKAGARGRRVRERVLYTFWKNFDGDFTFRRRNRVRALHRGNPTASHCAIFATTCRDVHYIHISALFVRTRRDKRILYCTDGA